jgi:hypothetical protein
MRLTILPLKPPSFSEVSSGVVLVVASAKRAWSKPIIPSCVKFSDFRCDLPHPDEPLRYAPPTIVENNGGAWTERHASPIPLLPSLLISSIMPDTDELNQLLDTLLASGDHAAIDEIAEFIEEHLRAQQSGVRVDETASLTRLHRLLKERGTDLRGL